MRTTLGFVLLASFASAQPTVAPTGEPVGLPRGQNIDGYNITNSFETGYRFRSVGGNLGKYRSDVNFGNGVRLLGSTLSIHSREGRGRYFDELLLNTQGLGDDPYQFSSFRIQKNRLYRYDLLWRENEYFNPALPIAGGQHFMDTTRRLQDHSIVLLPQSAFKIFAGFSRNTQSGPALSTVYLFDFRGDEFPLFSNVRRVQNEYRLGAELQLFGVRLSVLRGWEDFRDDTQLNSGSQPGNSIEDLTILQSFRRDEPYHGSTRNWRVNLLSERGKYVSVNGRFTYAGGRRQFIFDESAIGADRFGAARNRQLLLFGDARRPVTTASLTLSFFPTERVTIVNHTAFHNTRIDGDAGYRELNNATLGLTLAYFDFLGIRNVTNSTDANVRLGARAGVFAGYQFSDREVRSVQQIGFGSEEPERTAATQNNRLHAGRFGFRVQPLKPLSIVVDAELGRADRPVYPISERNYHALGGRVQYKTRSLLLSALARSNYNTNSVSLFSHSSRSRFYAADASWTPRTWIGFDANYSKQHLDTLSGIAYFYDGSLIDNDRSTYISNIHAAHVGVRVGIGSRVDLFAAWSRVEDTGDGRRFVPAGAVPGSLAYQVYPLTFESPLARVSVRLHPKVRWNVGYQHYRYSEMLLQSENYRAHTGYTSLTWAF